MKTTHKQILLTATLVGALTPTTHLIAAQDSTNAVEKATSESSERPPYWPWSVGFEAGTGGLLGGFGSWRFSDHLGVRGGVDYIETSWNHLGVAGIEYNAKAKLLSAPLVLDVYPWKNHSFHIGLGLMFNQNELSGSASGTGTINIDGKPFPIDQVGTLTMSIKQQPVDPYLTIGGNFFYFDHAHHLAFGGELGVAYTGDVRASLNQSGPAGAAIDNAVENALHDLHRYGNQFQWWPVVKLAVTYSFGYSRNLVAGLKEKWKGLLE